MMSLLQRSVLIGIVLQLCFVSQAIAFTAGWHTQQHAALSLRRERSSTTELAFFRRLFRRKKNPSAPPVPEPAVTRSKRIPVEPADLCVIGGGVSGLVAATEAAKKSPKAKIILLEAEETLGGRVQSDKTPDGFTLDRGFAVFIEDYPVARNVLDYEQLKLQPFLPGALVKITETSNLARVADPLRQPEELLTALFAPVGTFVDKMRLLLVIQHALSTPVENLFTENETDTETELRERWGLSDTFIDRFFRPFLEGIYLAPLSEQSSRMFNFIFKMFSTGAATLPAGGMGAIAEQLASKAKDAGVDLRTNSPVANIRKEEDGYVITTELGKSTIRAKNVVVATDGAAAQKLLSQINGLEELAVKPEQPQRQVMCMYYAFDSPAPVEEPVLILNGVIGKRGTAECPVNNACFPSIVNEGYAPEGKGLCSVTILKDIMDVYEGKEGDLDIAVREQLGTWFPEFKDDILSKWELKGTYKIKNAQPAQLGGPFPASINGGRSPTTYRGVLPQGLLVCGDHMATATLNGALESGLRAGEAAAKLL
jgi:phytoene dehydrogenase-like protein